MGKRQEKMFARLFCFLFVFYGNVNGIRHEPHCNKFSFEEQLLEKMVKMENKVENMFDSMAKTQSDVKDLASTVSKELNLLSKERERIMNEIIVHKVDISKTLVDTATATEQIVNDFRNKTLTLLKEQSVTYIRWGRTSCPNESKLLYEGYASGSHYSHSGGPSHTICLPKDPQHGNTHPGEDGNYIYNAEYEDDARTKSIYGENIGDQDVPCVVCEATGRTAVLMIPARLECYKGWHLEYSGYLMTENQSHKRNDMKCVDANPEKIPGQSGSDNGNLFYFVEVAGTIPDPPYTRGAELTCAVCTK